MEERGAMEEVWEEQRHDGELSKKFHRKKHPRSLLARVVVAVVVVVVAVTM